MNVDYRYVTIAGRTYDVRPYLCRALITITTIAITALPILAMWAVYNTFGQ